MRKILVGSILLTCLANQAMADDKVVPKTEAATPYTDSKAETKGDVKATNADSKGTVKDTKAESKSTAIKTEKTGPAITRKCLLEFTADGAPLGKVLVGMYGGVVPKTTENFMGLCAEIVTKSENKSGKNAKASKYADSTVHRVIPGFMIQAGDYEKGNGTGGASIYGPKFADENFELKHVKAGLLSMANSGPNTNGSQFFITVAATPWLDGKHVVFGEVMDEASMKVVKQIEALGSQSGNTTKKIKIARSSEVGGK